MFSCHVLCVESGRKTGRCHVLFVLGQVERRGDAGAAGVGSAVSVTGGCARTGSRGRRRESNAVRVAACWLPSTVMQKTSSSSACFPPVSPSLPIEI